MKSILITTLGLLVASLAPQSARAWNDCGHMTVAELAWRKLSNSEREAITTLLRKHPHFSQLLATNMPSTAADTNEWIFLRAATWPDMVRPPGQAFFTDFHHGDWHFTNAPFVAPAHLATIHPPTSGAGKILEALSANEAIVKDTTKPLSDRAVALCWLLHLVGDLHQPLHCVAWFSPEFPPPEGDHGGNFVAIRPKTAAVKLHIYWDARLGKGSSPEPTPKYINDRADWVAGEFPPGSSQPAELAHNTYPQWAQESFEEAEIYGYLNGDLNHAVIPPGQNGLNLVVDADVPSLNTDYDIDSRDRARHRAALAGIRLGEKLKLLF